MPQHNHDRFDKVCNPAVRRQPFKDQPIMEGPSEEDHEVKIWIDEFCTTISSDAPGGKPDFNDMFGHGWMTNENLTAGNMAGVTYLFNPAGKWDEEERKKPLLLPARVGTYPLGDFAFARDEGSTNVSVTTKEGTQSLTIGQLRLDKVKRLGGVGVINAAENEAWKTNSPGSRSLTHTWPAMSCTIKVTTAYGSTPLGEESDSKAIHM